MSRHSPALGSRHIVKLRFGKSFAFSIANPSAGSFGRFYHSNMIILFDAMFPFCDNNRQSDACVIAGLRDNETEHKLSKPLRREPFPSGIGSRVRHRANLFHPERHLLSDSMRSTVKVVSPTGEANPVNGPGKRGSAEQSGAHYRQLSTKLQIASETLASSYGSLVQQKAKLRHEVFG